MLLIIFIYIKVWSILLVLYALKINFTWWIFYESLIIARNASDIIHFFIWDMKNIKTKHILYLIFFIKIFLIRIFYIRIFFIRIFFIRIFSIRIIRRNFYFIILLWNFYYSGIFFDLTTYLHSSKNAWP